ncbi:arsenic transporter [Campylobacter aviculae]|uniref:Arsenic transporter n=1 Tax=Campylobacter aviculae TaxID=2510190 RepID=A0A4U7BIR5_9BACT|nr:arsenic transporter [Campylobacter aviculae]TKX31399.1 arsenic transporter [Campylobacter aviculae]
MLFASVIFLVTLIFIFWRPWNLPLWIISSFGAFFVFIFKLVNLKDIIFISELVWDSSLTLIGLIILSFSLEALGFFNFIAREIVSLSKNKSNYKINTNKLMFLLLIFVFLLTAFLGNDGAILVITPIVIALFSTLKDIKKSMILNLFLLSVSFLCDASSNTFIISNLTNIITAKYFNLGFLEFAKIMFLPNLLVLFSTLFMVYFGFLKALPREIEIRTHLGKVISKKLFIFCIFYLTLFVASFFMAEFFNLNTSLFALCGSLFFWFLVYCIKKRKALNVIRQAPWSIFIFSFGLYMIVFALHKSGVSNVLYILYDILSQNKLSAIFGTGFISAFLSSIFNNLPMTLIGNLALKDFPTEMIYAHLLGVNIGSKLTPIGSLATLFWLGLLAKKGIQISFWQYCKFSFFVTIPILMCSFLGIIFQ